MILGTYFKSSDGYFEFFKYPALGDTHMAIICDRIDYSVHTP